MFIRTLTLVALFLAVAPAASAQSSPMPAERPARVDAYGDALPDQAVTRLGTLRWRHGTPVVFVGYADHDQQLITVSQDGLIHVWETATGKEIRRIGKSTVSPDVGRLEAQKRIIHQPHIVVTATALTANGKTAATCVQGGVITLWEIDTGKELRVLRPSVPVYFTGLCFSANGEKLVARGNDQTLRIFRIADGKETDIISHPVNGPKRTFLSISQAPSMGFSPDGKILLYGAMEYDNNRYTALLKRWDTEARKELPSLRGPQLPVQALALSPDGTRGAWSTNDGFLRVWDLVAGKELRQMGGVQQGGFAAAMAFSPDGKFLISRGNDQIVRLWDIEQGKQLHQLGGPNQAIFNGFNRYFGQSFSNLAFAADGKSVAYGTNGNTVRQWQVGTGQEKDSVPGHHGAVVAAALSADGKTVATQGGNNTIHVWDAATGKPLRHFDLPTTVSHVIFSADGKTLATATVDGTLQVRDVATGKEIRQWKANQANRFGQVGLTGIALSPDGKTVATRGFDAITRLWDVASGREQHQIAETSNQQGVVGNGRVFIGGANGTGPGMVFSPDGATLATYTAGGQVFVAAPNGVFLPQNQACSLQLWDVATGKAVRKFLLGNTHLTCFAFAPDGRTLAGCGADGHLILWEVISGKERFHVNNLGGPLATLIFAPDGRTLLGAGNDSLVRIWSSATGTQLHQLQGHQGAIATLALADNGKTLVSGSNDTTALVWNVAALPPEQRPNQNLEAEKLETLWNVLASDDAKSAYAAIHRLANAPGQTVPAFVERVKPMTPPDPRKVAQLIDDLNSNSFPTRQKAHEELEKLGELVEPVFKQVLAGQPSLEMRVRIERLLERLVTDQTPPAEELRCLRALEVLEMLRTPEARAVLEKLSQGAPGSRLTRDARDALRRLAKQ